MRAPSVSSSIAQRFSTRATTFTLLVLALFANANTAIGQGRLAITDPEQGDDAYHLQGEYYGDLTHTLPGSSVRTLGLQIVAQGEGNFLAVEYPGGLPGNGWNRQVRYTMAVSQTEDAAESRSLWVPSDGYQLQIAGNRATVSTYDGRILGRLEKVIRESPTLGVLPPESAAVLFDGTHTDYFKNGRIDENGWLQRGTELTKPYTDFLLHIEFRTPYMPTSRGQQRGNSGVYLQSRYEVQILDSFGLGGVFNECGALYRTVPPRLNMCLPPLQWQTYDLEFHAAQFDEENKKIKNAELSLRHNGVFVHYKLSVPNKTGAGQPEGPQPLVTKLQDHSDPVVFRNIWLVDLAPQAPTLELGRR